MCLTVTIHSAFFSRKGKEKYLEALLEGILNEPVKIKKVIHDSRLEQLAETAKYEVLDLEAERDNGEIFNIEMQLRNTDSIEKRTTFYSSKKIAEQMVPTMPYREIKNVIAIAC